MTIAMFVLAVAMWAESPPPAPKQLPLRSKDVPYHFVRFSPDARSLVMIVRQWAPEANSYTWELVVFDLALEKEVRRLIPPAGMKPQEAFFSPDGKTLAARAAGAPLVLWNLGEGKELCKLESSTEVYDPVFTSDGRRVVGRVPREVAQAHPDRFAVAVWDVASGKKVGEIQPGSRGQIQAFALAVDGQHILAEHHRLVGVDDDGRFCVPWNVRTHVWCLTTGKDLGTVGRLTEYKGTGDEYFSPGHNLFLAGATGFGYCRRGIHGEEHFWTPWAGRIALSQSGRPVVLADYRATTPILERHGAQFLLVNPNDGKPLHERSYFDMGHLHAVDLAPNGTKVAAVEFERGVARLLLWDVTDLAGTVRTPPELDEACLRSLWNELSSEDTRRAHTSMRVLAAAPARSVAFLRTKVRPAPALALDGEQVRQWIANLDSDKFSVREAGTRELERLGGMAKPALEKAFATKPSLEARRRIEGLLEMRDDRPVPPKELSALRAVDVLEQIGTEEACQLLRSLAEGAEGASPTRAANQALARLGSQRKKSP